MDPQNWKLYFPVRSSIQLLHNDCEDICRELLPICFHGMGSSIHDGIFLLTLQTSEPGSALLTLLETFMGPCKCPRIQWIYTGIKRETVGQREPGLRAVRLREKRSPFLLNIPGIHFAFLDFVVFAQLGSFFIVHINMRGVTSHEEPFTVVVVIGPRENSLRNGLS